VPSSFNFFLIESLILVATSPYDVANKKLRRPMHIKRKEKQLELSQEQQQGYLLRTI
jgi:hypothetical protein